MGLENGNRNSGDRGIIFTLQAKCRDCYRCLKVCPVKAIRMEQGQAFVDKDTCIVCGTCIRECPRNAKVYRNDLDHVKNLLTNHGFVAASIAPAFAAVYPADERKRLISALRMLGFSYVAETSNGAYHVARASADYINDNRQAHHVCSACPVIVSYIENYHGEKTEHLIPIASPMIAHGKNIKRMFAHPVKVVFIGPCIAKKGEADRDETIDGVLTFSELDTWLHEAGIILKNCDESEFDDTPRGCSRLYPVPGAFFETAGIDHSTITMHHVAVSGIPLLDEALEYITHSPSPFIIEPLFCKEGCLNGPGCTNTDNLFTRKKRLLDYTQESTTVKNIYADFISGKRLRQQYTQGPPADTDFSEEQIRVILAKIGKYEPEDELNCKACGYNSCREKARAVLKGMAEVDMCLPYMRKLAEQRTDRIIETAPDGIVVIDTRFIVLKANRAFYRMFKYNNYIIGKPLSRFMDPSSFEELIAGAATKIEQKRDYPDHNLVCHELCYALEEHGQYVGMYRDMTEFYRDKKLMHTLKQDTVKQAKELLAHQIEMAQTITTFVGENSAIIEALVNRMVHIAGGDGDEST